MEWNFFFFFCSSLVSKTVISGNNAQSKKRKILKGGKKGKNWFDILELEEWHREVALYCTFSHPTARSYSDPTYKQKATPIDVCFLCIEERSLGERMACSGPLQGKCFPSPQHLRLSSPMHGYKVAGWHPSEGFHHIT